MSTERRTGEESNTQASLVAAHGDELYLFEWSRGDSHVCWDSACFSQSSLGFLSCTMPIRRRKDNGSAEAGSDEEEKHGTEVGSNDVWRRTTGVH